MCPGGGGVAGASAWWRAALQVRLVLGGGGSMYQGWYFTIQRCEGERLEVRLVARGEKTEGVEWPLPLVPLLFFVSGLVPGNELRRCP